MEMLACNLDVINTEMRDMILTQMVKDVLSVGEIQVKRKDDLREIRDSLLNYCKNLNNYQVTKKELAGFSSILKTGFFREGNSLVHQFITSMHEDDCEYVREEIEFVYLNSILLFTSLLGELDATNYNEIAQQAIGKGIIYCMPFKSIWKKCSTNMVNKVVEALNDKNQKWKKEDLKAFRAAFNEGIIAYEGKHDIVFSELVGQKLWFNCKDMQELDINNAVILGDKSLFTKIRKCK